MATKAKTSAKTEKPKAETTAKSENINQLKEMYNDFVETIGEMMGDAGQFVLKHKALVFIGFLLYLWHRNRTFTIEGFVKKLEERLAEDRDW